MSDGEIYSDKRKHERAAKNFSITYEVISSDLNDTKNISLKERRLADCFNLSLGGICLITGEILSPDQVIVVKFILDEKPIITYAEVRWSKLDKKDNKYLTGIEFLAIDEAYKNIIKKALTL